MNKTLSNFKKSASLIVFASAILENIFFFSALNVFASFILVYGWLLIKSFVLTSNNLKLFPVSFFMMLGLAIVHFILPMPLTLLEFNAVTFNLRVPFLTFFHHFLFVTVIVFTHFAYTKISSGKNIFRVFLNRTNFYYQPTDRIIWITSFLGLFASFYNYFIFDAWQKEVTDRNFLYHLNAILAQFIWMPIIIPFSKFRDIPNCPNKNSIKYIVLYSLFVFMIAVASNWRTVLFSGVVIVSSMLLIGILMQYYNLSKIFTAKKAVLIFAIVLFVTGPLVDLGYAMVVVRHDRDSLSAVEFVDKTLSIFNNKEVLERVKSVGSSGDGFNSLQSNAWDEEYLHNIIINRFVNLKISDNSLFFAEKIGYQNEIMQSEFVNQLVAFLPNIFANYFGLDIAQKIDSSSYSIGDFLYSLAVNDTSVRGSAVISSMPGVGMAIFGYWYLILIVPLFVVIFSMFDSFVKMKNGKIIFSYFFFLMIVTIINYFNDRHVFTFEFRFILRTYFESVILFLIVMKIITSIDSVFIKHKSVV